MGNDLETVRNATVLVVDDNDANRALAKETLEDEGHRVVIAAGGSAAIAAFEAARPDCVLLDVRMPEIDGFTVCERIRASNEGADVPVIFLTALRDVDTFDRALRAGGDDFLTKPVRPTELVVRVQSALRLRRMRTELREHYDLLKQQRDALLRVQLQKERLTAFVVHDLKNPVNAIDLHAQVLVRDKCASEGVHATATQIRTEARRLTRLILNLLDLSKGDEGKLSPHIALVDLSALVEEVASELELRAEARGVRIIREIGAPGAMADADLLRRLLANLVENAIRHTAAKSTVTISSRTRDGAVEIYVSDEGPGIPADMRAANLDPFVQLEGRAATDDAASSRGLGLAFCKLAAEAHGGRISVEDPASTTNASTVGTVFVVRLPNEP